MTSSDTTSRTGLNPPWPPLAARPRRLLLSALVAALMVAAGTGLTRLAGDDIADWLAGAPLHRLHALEPGQEWRSPHCAAPETHEIADYCAQLRSVRAAEASVMLSVMQMLLSVVGVVVVVRTFRSTKAAAEAAQQAANEATKANETAREGHAIDRRAWLAIDEARLRPPGDGGSQSLAVEVAIRNIGQTPAFNVAVDSELLVFANDPTSLDERSRLDAATSALAIRDIPTDYALGAMMFPGESMTRTYQVTASLPATVADTKMKAALLVCVRYTTLIDQFPRVTLIGFDMLNATEDAGQAVRLDPLCLGEGKAT